MKKVKYLLLILAISLLTGCIKFNVGMDIKKDKSMQLSMIYAINKALLEDDSLTLSDNSSLLDESEIAELEKQGYTIKDYVDGDMKGYKLTRFIKNIDDVSTEKNTEYSLSGVLEENSDSYLFKVTRGLLKNTYKAKFSFDTSDSGLLNSDNQTSDETNDSQEVEDDTDLDLTEDLDFSSLASSMDLSFNVNLPYAAKSNNATNTTDGLKNLTWKLDSSGMEAIEFEFELYNMTNIYVGIGVIALFIILIIVIILCIRKGKNNKVKTSENLVNQTPINSKETVNIAPVMPQPTIETQATVSPPPQVQPKLPESSNSSTSQPTVNVNNQVNKTKPKIEQLEEDL